MGDLEHVSPSELREKLKEYSAFIDSTLHPELQKAVSAREQTESEIQEYQELHDKLALLQNEETKKPLQSLVNLGHELVYCAAEVDDPSTVFVNVGMGFHIEFNLEEAMSVILKRIAFLQENVLPKRLEDAQRVAAHLEASMIILEALARDVHIDS